MSSRRVVVKCGTAVMLGSEGKLQGALLMSLARQIRELRDLGWEVVVVSSGAVGMGRSLLKTGQENLREKQALAALGQVELMNVWRRLFDLLDVQVAQVLLTREDLRARERYLNARHTLVTLLSAGVMPVINENDSVAVTEIRFGDNDILSCLVGALLDAEMVINLTQAPGLLDFSEDPPRRLPLVQAITPDIMGLVRSETSRGGTGGMLSKLEAAKVALECGTSMVIAKAQEPDVILRVVQGDDVGTRFVPGGRRLSSRKRWLAAGGAPRGKLHLDAGAIRALLAGGSVLPVGIHSIEGEFGIGDLVSLIDPDGVEKGRGLVNYPTHELQKLKGQPSSRLEELLGYRGHPEAVHRDHLYARAEGGN
ncbi:glutamate 5-kinase [bacterium SCN 62-11]|nr:glutamate 5-kinase [Candidatus Eremiobacteraeota bacterium]ODT78808.1 MAG: glutamate 5-kinase [bacterium SCN 62-11]